MNIIRDPDAGGTVFGMRAMSALSPDADAMIQECVNRVSADLGNDIAAYLDRIAFNARTDEREACAKVAEATNDCCECSGRGDDDSCQHNCPTAAAIRARSHAC